MQRGRRLVPLLHAAVAASPILVAATLYAIVLLALDPALRRPADATLLLGYLIVFHTALLTPFVAMAWLLVWFARRRLAHPTGSMPLFACSVTLCGAALLGLNLVLRFPISYALFREPRVVTPLGVVNVTLAAATVPALAAVLWLSLGGRRVRAGGAALALASAWVLLVALNDVAARPASAPLPEPPLEAPKALPAAWSEARSPEKVLLLGLDGLSWRVVSELLAAGELPNLASLMAGGARAALRSEVPTLSPSLWTTIATGRSRGEHGIHGFSFFRLPGMAGTLHRGPGLANQNWWSGLNRMLGALAVRGVIEQRLYRQSDRRCAALWEVAAHHGRTVGVVNWYVTFPASAPGPPGSYMVAFFQDSPGSHTLGPRESAVAAIPSRLQALEQRRQLPRNSWFLLHAIRDDATMMRAAALQALLRPDLGLAYAHLPDTIQHLSRAEGWGRPEAGELPETVLAAYRLADQWVGAFLEAAGPETVTLVVSDHGYAFDGREHHHAPDGIFLAAGPGIRRGALLEDASIYDVAPTVLALLGLPISRELTGRVLGEALGSGVPPPRHVADYAWFRPSEEAAERSTEDEAETLQRLRSLGYVN